MGIHLKPIDKAEILTLQDNYIDMAAMDSTDTVQRALPLKDMEVKNSILAEHGFSAVVTLTSDDQARTVLFDFGFSEHGAGVCSHLPVRIWTPSICFITTHANATRKSACLMGR